MKTMRNVLMLVMLLGTLVIDVSAQGRSRGNKDRNPGHGHDKEYHPENDHNRDDQVKNDFQDRHHRDHKDQNRNYTSHHNRYDYRDHNNRSCDYSSHHDRHSHHDHYVTYSHHRYGPPSWAPAYGYRYNTRYVYYRDYNVYYDCYRDVFITWTGRSWSISTRVPVTLLSVNFGRAAVIGVDYWDDDLDFYLERRRPVYVSIQTFW